MRRFVLPLVLLLGAPAHAQSEESVSVRLDRVERQLRGVQRGATPGTVPAPTGQSGADPAIERRLNAIEARLTQLADAVAALRAAPPPTLPPPSTSTPAPVPTPAPTLSTAAPPGPNAGATTGDTGPRAASAPVVAPVGAATRTSAARLAATALVERPETGDAVEDDYSYAFRLYDAKLYPEAVTALKAFIAQHPAERRTSYARNLLGRAYDDDGKPALASVAFYDNYDKQPKGERAAESLSRLGVALVALGKPGEACRVFGELDRAFADQPPEVRARSAKGRADARCPA